MLKLTVNKDDYNSLDESIKSFYSESDDGYKLKVDGVEDTGALKRAKDHEKEQRKAIEKEAQELRDKLTAIEQEKLKGSGDIDAILASADKAKEDAEARIKAIEDEYRQKEETLFKQNRESFKNAQIKELAVGLAKEGHSDALVPYLKSKFDVIDDNGSNKLVVLGEDGKPSHLTIDNFKDEFKSNTAFAPLLKGSQATGSGAKGGVDGGGTTKKFTDYTSAELVQLHRENPEAYNQLKSQH